MHSQVAGSTIALGSQVTGGHAHVPSMQVDGAAHVVSQDPQLSELVSVLTQSPPHSINPGEQLHSQAVWSRTLSGPHVSVQRVVSPAVVSLLVASLPAAADVDVPAWDPSVDGDV
jgi:hypothetical protein